MKCAWYILETLTIPLFLTRQMVKGFKFGVLYCREGQVTENEYFNNTEEGISPPTHALGRTRLTLKSRPGLSRIFRLAGNENLSCWMDGLQRWPRHVWPSSPLSSYTDSPLPGSETVQERILSTPRLQITRSCSTCPLCCPIQRMMSSNSLGTHLLPSF